MNQEETWLLDEKYGGEKTDAFLDDCVRLKMGEPLAYIIGYIPFRSSIIHLDSRPLIPRTESEFWIGEIIESIQQKAEASHEPIRILDLCAGSGALGIAILTEIQNTHVDFAEIETAHHDTIKKNILSNKIRLERARVLGGNLFEHIDGTYDYIISNPPYIDPALDRAEPSVKAHEPTIALYGGKNGLELITEIIKHATQHLTQDGVLVLEHEPEQSHAISDMAEKYGFTATTHTDQYEMERYTILTRKAS